MIEKRPDSDSSMQRMFLAGMDEIGFQGLNPISETEHQETKRKQQTIPMRKHMSQFRAAMGILAIAISAMCCGTAFGQYSDPWNTQPARRQSNDGGNAPFVNPHTIDWKRVGRVAAVALRDKDTLGTIGKGTSKVGQGVKKGLAAVGAAICAVFASLFSKKKK